MPYLVCRGHCSIENMRSFSCLLCWLQTSKTGCRLVFSSISLCCLKNSRVGVVWCLTSCYSAYRTLDGRCFFLRDKEQRLDIRWMLVWVHLCPESVSVGFTHLCKHRVIILNSNLYEVKIQLSTRFLCMQYILGCDFNSRFLVRMGDNCWNRNEVYEKLDWTDSIKTHVPRGS